MLLKRSNMSCRGVRLFVLRQEKSGDGIIQIIVIRGGAYEKEIDRGAP
jgi:hypothetical protein